jgi:hypothetical protein
MTGATSQVSYPAAKGHHGVLPPEKPICINMVHHKVKDFSLWLFIALVVYCACCLLRLLFIALVVYCAFAG